MNRETDRPHSARCLLDPVAGGPLATGCFLLLCLLCLGGCTPPICTAAIQGDVEKVRRLLEEDPAQVNAHETSGRGYSVTSLAAENGHAEVVAVLLDAGARIEPIYLMQLAASKGENSVLEVLLERGLPVQGNGFGSPLQSAAVEGHPATVEFLLAHGADIDEQRDDGCAALHYAAFHGRATVVALLLARGADLELTDGDGWTPLFHAAAGGHPDAAEVLLAKGANVNARSARGWTPLMRAVANGQRHVLPVLLAHGADVEVRNHDRDTALTLAEKNNRPAIADILRGAAGRSEGQP